VALIHCRSAVWVDGLCTGKEEVCSPSPQPRGPDKARPPKNAVFCLQNTLRPSHVTPQSSSIKHLGSLKVLCVRHSEMLLHQIALWCWPLCLCSPWATPPVSSGSVSPAWEYKAVAPRWDAPDCPRVSSLLYLLHRKMATRCLDPDLWIGPLVSVC